jgi:hypothetical protein
MGTSEKKMNLIVLSSEDEPTPEAPEMVNYQQEKTVSIMLEKKEEMEI